MDPNKMGQLDPKLKEAYDRVMNASVTPAQPPLANGASPATSQTPNGNAQTPATPLGAPPPPPSQVTQKPFIHNSPPVDSAPINVSHSSAPAAVPAATMAAKFPTYKAGTLKAKKSGSVPMALWAVLAVVFFVAYTFIWIRVLGVNLPFLP